MTNGDMNSPLIITVLLTRDETMNRFAIAVDWLRPPPCPPPPPPPLPPSPLPLAVYILACWVDTMAWGGGDDDLLGFGGGEVWPCHCYWILIISWDCGL